jgi:hypothetical protein
MGINFLQDQDPADPEEILELLSNFKSSTFEENFDSSQQKTVRQFVTSSVMSAMTSSEDESFGQIVSKFQSPKAPHPRYVINIDI